MAGQVPGAPEGPRQEKGGGGGGQHDRSERPAGQVSPREESGFRSGAVGSHTGLLFCFVFVSYIEVYLTHTEKSTNYKCARLQVFTRGDQQ